jgi:hypothetical protein
VVSPNEYPKIQNRIAKNTMRASFYGKSASLRHLTEAVSEVSSWFMWVVLVLDAANISSGPTKYGSPTNKCSEGTAWPGVVL